MCHAVSMLVSGNLAVMVLQLVERQTWQEERAETLYSRSWGVHIPPRSCLARLELGKICARAAHTSSRSRGTSYPGSPWQEQRMGGESGSCYCLFFSAPALPFHSEALLVFRLAFPPQSCLPCRSLTLGSIRRPRSKAGMPSTHLSLQRKETPEKPHQS